MPKAVPKHPCVNKGCGWEHSAKHVWGVSAFPGKFGSPSSKGGRRGAPGSLWTRSLGQHKGFISRVVFPRGGKT